ncbi:hypothetical protein C3766_05285 [Heyndrickxia coagulans]|nr:hypothetical protein C3766_05285 [Heyndrickxia coagulans]
MKLPKGKTSCIWTRNAFLKVKSRLLCKFMGKCFQPPLHFFGLTSMDFFLHLREGMSNAFQFDIPSRR